VQKTIYIIGLACIFTLTSHAENNDSIDQTRNLIVVKNGLVLSMDKHRTIFENGVVVIQHDSIIAVGGKEIAARYAGAHVIDAEGGIVMPGMINLHNHLSMVAFRGLAESGLSAADNRLYKYFFPLEKNLLDRELIRVAARHAAMEMALGGVTLTTDMYYHEDEVAQAVKEVGIRGVLAETSIGFPVVDAAKPFAGLAYAEKYIQDWQGDSLITPAIAPHAPYTVSPQELLKAKVLAEKYNVPLLIHVAEFAEERAKVASAYPDTTQNRSVVQYLDDIGFLGPNVLAAHVNYVDQTDIEILRDKNVGVSHNPKANTKGMSGLSPAWQMYKAGVAIGLGTDGPMSSNQMDVVSVMPYAARVARLGAPQTAKFDPVEIVEMATINGARAINMQGSIGSLEVGKQADLVIFETKSLNMQPNYDVYATLVFSAYPTNVVLTMVAGKVVAQNGKIMNVDLGRHQSEWTKIVKKVADFSATLD
jgi:cytosine/adenosine deaminase-related metal-dependent hydrolase